MRPVPRRGPGLRAPAAVLMVLATAWLTLTNCASARPGGGVATTATAPAATTAPPGPRPLDLRLPGKKDSIRFAAIGDTGTGSREQYQVAAEMTRYREAFPFDFVLMLGDDLYGGSTPRDFQLKFEQPYAALIKAQVKFYSSLGNHDNPLAGANYKDWNMNGKRYYTWRESRGGVGVRFFALDSNYMDQKQLEWLESELTKSSSEWKIAFFHHPLYSSGRFHGSSLDLRKLLEPLFIRHDVSVVLSGHDHVYERVKPQHGILYFVCGSSGTLRRGNLDRNSGLTDVGFDTDLAFMLLEVNGGDLFYQTISRTGETVDSGTLHHAPLAEGSDKAAHR